MVERSDNVPVGRIVRRALNRNNRKPNVGKSSLLNALLRENRAIVTEVRGLQGMIEEYINLKGIPLRLMDTAGIRETDDLVESIGVEKTRVYMENADLVLLVLDAARPLSKEDRAILDIIKDKRSIVLINKTDLEIRLDEREITDRYPEWPVIHMSLVQDRVGCLEDTIYNLVFSDGIRSSDVRLWLPGKARGLSQEWPKEALGML